MASFFHHVLNLEPRYYFLVGFLVLWGAGMLWAVLFVFFHVMKKAKAGKALKSMKFEPARDNPVYLERVKENALNTVYRDFLFPCNGSIKTTVKKGKIRISCSAETPREDLPRPIGLKERVQIVGRSVTLRKIYYRKYGDMEAFYAQIVDSKTTRRFRNRRDHSSYHGWILCVCCNTGYSSTFTVHPKFHGTAKILRGLAFKIAHVNPVCPAGLLPAFSRHFDMGISGFDGGIPSLDEDSQNKILSFKESFCEDTRLTLDPAGVWLSRTVWPEPGEFTRLATLCYSLARGRKKAS